VPEHVAVSERLQALLEAHSYALVRVTAGALEVLLEAEVGAVRFFSQPTAWKAKHASPGGRVGQLLLWSCGFTSWPNRQQWHVVCGAPDAPSWPLVEAALHDSFIIVVGLVPPSLTLFTQHLLSFHELYFARAAKELCRARITVR
jgi:hypothetical protein